MKNMPLLQKHLQEEWDKQEAKAKAKAAKQHQAPALKRKASTDLANEAEEPKQAKIHDTQDVQDAAT